MPELRP